ncbi:unnamed protein product [Nesidiocoris tenuis]|uniref:Uncharacterized protein n=1 Tax=Nesidiocoris tenuis TaxID=355587 RepID=A0A6H5GKE5_9HEMI|nr:unnamed protein product [Nesidiocoris tenuis]
MRIDYIPYRPIVKQFDLPGVHFPKTSWVLLSCQNIETTKPVSFTKACEADNHEDCRAIDFATNLSVLIALLHHHSVNYK